MTSPHHDTNVRLAGSAAGDARDAGHVVFISG